MQRRPPRSPGIRPPRGGGWRRASWAGVPQASPAPRLAGPAGSPDLPMAGSARSSAPAAAALRFQAGRAAGTARRRPGSRSPAPGTARHRLTRPQQLPAEAPAATPPAARRGACPVQGPQRRRAALQERTGSPELPGSQPRALSLPDAESCASPRLPGGYPAADPLPGPQGSLSLPERRFWPQHQPGVGALLAPAPSAPPSAPQ